jgi:hypothetical protein
VHQPLCRNYVKFLVNGDGQAVKRYNPSFDPLDAETDVRLTLAGKPPTPAECFLHPGRKVCKWTCCWAGTLCAFVFCGLRPAMCLLLGLMLPPGVPAWNKDCSGVEGTLR